jgi:putative tricarboxylic transport membrane protein
MDFGAIGDAAGLLSSSPLAWAVVVPGLLIGLIAGAIPGFSVSLAMAIFLPMTLYMDFLSAMLFLTAVFTGGGFGTAIPSILINIPGSGAAVATAFDGYPMTRQGQHNKALGLALMASATAMLVSYAVLFLLIDQISKAVLALGPLEMLIIAVWGLTLIATLRGRHVARGLLAGAFGVLLGTVGLNAYGAVRGTMGIPELIEGFPVVPALIGMFAAAELFNLGRRDFLVEDESQRKVSLAAITDGMWQTRKYGVTVLRGGIIGLVIGAIPGVGAAVANLVSYGEARRRSRDPHSFGQGNPHGVVAAESANSSSEGGSMATLLALGIPGGAGTAVMLGAFSMHNITGGPRFLLENKDIVYAIILANFVQGILLVGLGLAFCRYAAALVKVPLRYLVPAVLAMTVLGAYCYTTNIWGPITVFLFAVLGWVMKRYDYPVAATVIGLLLGQLVEGELLRSYQISGGDWRFILERPIAIGFAALLLASLVIPAVRQVHGWLRQRDAAPAAESNR